MKRLSQRLEKLEKSFGPPEDQGQEALDRAIQQAPLEVLQSLYEATMRLYPPSSHSSDRIALDELWPNLTPIEAEAVEELVRIAESLL